MREDLEREQWAEAWTESGYVFTKESVEPVRPAQLSQVFEDLVTRSALPDSKLHGLRHVHASLLLATGVSLAIVSKRLGHSTITVTADLYSHLLGDANRAAAEAAESMLPARAPLHTRCTLGRPESDQRPRSEEQNP